MGEFLKQRLSGDFLPQANEFAARVLRRVPLDAVIGVGLVYLAEHGDDEDFALGFPVGADGALLHGIRAAVNEATASREQKGFPGLPQRAWAAAEVIDQRLRSAEATASHDWRVLATRWLGSNFVVAFGVPRAALAVVPTTPALDDGEDSFVRHVLLQLAVAACDSLGATDLSGGFQPRKDVADVLRDAGESFVRAAMGAVHGNHIQQLFGGNVFERINRIAALQYEGGDLRGKIVFTRKGATTHAVLSFAKPVRLSDAVWARKTLEACTDSLVVLSTDDELLGLALSDAAIASYGVRLRGRQVWTLRYGATDLLEVRLGVPGLPRPALTRERFAATLNRVFGPECAVEELWPVVEVAMTQKHGTMIVVSAAASVEGERLAAQATPITPIRLDADLTRAVTAIDGAVLLDSAGTCHAFGVILDGVASGAGTPARGARFNSAVRYVSARKPEKVVAVVISEDGHVDLVPRLRPQITRAELDQLIGTATGQASVPHAEEALAARVRLLRDYSDYLSRDAWEIARVGLGVSRVLSRDDDDDRYEQRYDQHESDILE